MGFFKRNHSEPAREGRQRNVQPQNSHYGPHFDKGPQQEEIFNRRADGERFPKDHPELRDRAHSFHHPIQQHKYSDPYKKTPQPWTKQMEAEHRYYHALTDGEEMKAHTEAVTAAVNTRVGRKHVPTNAQGREIQAGITSAEACRNLTNRAVQARQGFVQKYPQPYENLRAMETHQDQVKDRRIQAKNFRETQRDLVQKHDKWATKMRDSSEASSRR